MYFKLLESKVPEYKVYDLRESEFDDDLSYTYTPRMYII